MHPVDFEGSNITLNKPEGWTDEQCQSIKAWHGIDAVGNVGFLTAWTPSEKDLEALNAGRPLFMKTVSEGFAPVALFTFDSSDNPNY